MVLPNQETPNGRQQDEVNTIILISTPPLPSEPLKNKKK